MSQSPGFLSYSPVELTFGTSGMRGLVSDMTDLEVYVSVKGALAYLRRVGDIKSGSTIVLGGDLRPSTERIARAAVQAIVASGFKVENAGTLPTPALVLRGIDRRRATVMVTGSHIPFDRNGIKISGSRGELLKSDERGVLDDIAVVRAEEYARTAETSVFNDSGMLKRPPRMPDVDPTAQFRYLRRYLDAFPADLLRGYRLAFYEHSAVGRELIPLILRGLGAEVMSVGRSETFVPIDTENIGEAQLAELTRLAAQLDWAVDAIVSTDGDSDRPLVAAIVHGAQRHVRFLPGDLLGVIAADWLGADAVAVPVSANDAVDIRLLQHGIKQRKTKIGSPYVISELDTLRAGGARRAMGWEANGGFLLGCNLPIGNSTLAALPTRDAVLPMIAMLAAATEQNLRLEQLWDGLPARFGRSGLIDELPPAKSRAILETLVKEGPAAIERYFDQRHGFGHVSRIDTLDGVRIYFDNGEVAHLRASGNAPQLRLYAFAPTQARADQIVSDGLAEPDGIVRSLERALAA